MHGNLPDTQVLITVSLEMNSCSKRVLIAEAEQMAGIKVRFTSILRLASSNVNEVNVVQGETC